MTHRQASMSSPAARGNKHLLVDVRALSPRRDGISSYIHGVVPRLLDLARDWDATLIANHQTAGIVRSWGADVVTSRSRPMWPGQNVSIPIRIARLQPSVFFYPAYDPPLGPIICPLVMTVHDLSPLLLRPYFESFDRAKRMYVWGVTSFSIRRAQRVIAVSGTTLESIQKLFGKVAARKTRVVHNGHEPTSPRVKETNAHLLYLGTDRPHKNLLRLIDAYAWAFRNFPGVPPLVLAGGFRNERAVLNRIGGLGIERSTRVVGHVPDDVAKQLLEDSVAFVMPSLAEGFGLPVLEAMVRGVPVITSDRSACREVADGAALLVDPLDLQSIGKGMVEVASNARLRATLSSKGLARAKQFSWDRAARLTFEEIEAAAETRQ